MLFLIITLRNRMCMQFTMDSEWVVSNTEAKTRDSFVRCAMFVLHKNLLIMD